jgi:hypothetical protein
MAMQRRTGLIAPTTTRTCHECLTEGHTAEADYTRWWALVLLPTSNGHSLIGMR